MGSGFAPTAMTWYQLDEWFSRSPSITCLSLDASSLILNWGDAKFREVMEGALRLKRLNSYSLWWTVPHRGAAVVQTAGYTPDLSREPVLQPSRWAGMNVFCEACSEVLSR